MKPIHKAIAGIFAATALISGGTQAQVRYDSRAVYTAATPVTAGVVESIDVVRPGNEGNKVAGAILGGLIGGVVGHQIGSGRGNDVATVAGALGGAAIGHGIGESRSGDNAYRVHVRLDNGDRHTFLQDGLDGLRVGDRVQTGTDRVYPLVSTDRYETPIYRTESTTPNYQSDSTPGYRTDSRGNRYDGQGYRVDDRGVRYDTENDRGAQQGFRLEGQAFRTDERGYRYDAAGYLIDERGYRIEQPGMRRDSQGYWIDERGNRYDAQGFWVDERGIRHEYQDAPRTYAVPPMPPDRSN